MRITQSEAETLQSIINPNIKHHRIDFYSLIKKLLKQTLLKKKKLDFYQLEKQFRMQLFSKHTNSVYGAQTAVIYLYGIFCQLHLLHGFTKDDFSRLYTPSKLANKMAHCILQSIGNSSTNDALTQLVTISLDASLTQILTNINEQSTLQQLMLLQRIKSSWLSGEYLLKTTSLQPQEIQLIDKGYVFFQQKKKNTWIIHGIGCFAYKAVSVDNNDCKTLNSILKRMAHKGSHKTIAVNNISDLERLKKIFRKYSFSPAVNQYINDTAIHNEFKSFHDIAKAIDSRYGSAYQQSYNKYKFLIIKNQTQLERRALLIKLISALLMLFCLVKVIEGALKSNLMPTLPYLLLLYISLIVSSRSHFYGEDNQGQLFFEKVLDMETTIAEQQHFVCRKYVTIPDDKQAHPTHGTTPAFFFQLSTNNLYDKVIDKPLNQPGSTPQIARVLKRYQLPTEYKLTEHPNKEEIIPKPHTPLPPHHYTTAQGQVIEIDPQKMAASGRHTDLFKGVRRFHNSSLRVYPMARPVTRKGPNGKNQQFALKVKRGRKDAFAGRLFIKPNGTFNDSPYYQAVVYSPKGAHNNR